MYANGLCGGCARDSRTKSYRKHKQGVRKRNQSPTVRLKQYRAGAAARGIEWALTDEQFMALWQMPCAYCGLVPESIGIDRVDSSQGYTPDNVVPCCKTCNRQKGTMAPDAFVQHAIRIAEKARRGA